MAIGVSVALRMWNGAPNTAPFVEVWWWNSVTITSRVGGMMDSNTMVAVVMVVMFELVGVWMSVGGGLLFGVALGFGLKVAR